MAVIRETIIAMYQFADHRNNCSGRVTSVEFFPILVYCLKNASATADFRVKGDNAHVDGEPVVKDDIG